MNDKETEQLFDLMLENYEEAEFIASNFESLNNRVREQVRELVSSELKTLNIENLSFKTGPISSTYAQLWIFTNSEDVYYGVESFSGKGNFNGNVFVGVWAKKNGCNNQFPKPGYNDIQHLIDNEGNNINFGSSKLLKGLFKNTERQSELASIIATQISEYIKEHPIQ